MPTLDGIQRKRHGLVAVRQGQKPPLGKDPHRKARPEKALCAAALGRQAPQEGQTLRLQLALAQPTLQRHPEGGELFPGRTQPGGLLGGEAAAAGEPVQKLQIGGLMTAGGQRGTDIDQLQLQRGVAPEGIGLQVEGRVHPAAGADAALFLRHGEENGVEAAGALGKAQLQVPPLAHGLDGVHRGPQQRQGGPGIAGAVGLQIAQVLRLRKGHLRGAGDGRVDVQAADGHLSAGSRAYIAVHPLAEGVDIALRDGEARGQLVAAEAVQEVGAGFQRRKEVEAVVGPARALAGAVLEVDHEAGTGVFLAQAGGDDAHHALVPVLTGEDQGAALLVGEAADLFHGVGADGLLHRLTLPVQLAQLLGKLLRPGGVGGLQQVRGQVRRAHASGGVDPGREHEADLDGGDGLSQKPRFFQKGMHAHKIRMGQSLQSAGDDGAVLPLHAHDIGDGTDGR